MSPGSRVVVRYRRDPHSAGPPLTDVVGELIDSDASVVRVATASGEVVIAVASIVAARRVEASRAAILRLEEVAALGWRARDVVEHEGWLLRADSGWTGRANSAIQLRTHDRPLDDHLEVVTEFYESRGLTPVISVPLPARELLDRELDRRGWGLRTPAIVMTRQVRSRPRPDAGETAVDLDPTPSPGWLEAYHYRGGTLPPEAEALLTRHDCVRFARIEHGGKVVAIARGAVDRHWLGLTAVEVDPAHRRRGHATALLNALTEWAATEGATHCYLQTEQENVAAVALYAGQGFSEHHRYQYRVAAR